MLNQSVDTSVLVCCCMSCILPRAINVISSTRTKCSTAFDFRSTINFCVATTFATVSKSILFVISTARASKMATSEALGGNCLACRIFNDIRQPVRRTFGFIRCIQRYFRASPCGQKSQPSVLLCFDMNYYMYTWRVRSTDLFGCLGTPPTHTVDSLTSCVYACSVHGFHKLCSPQTIRQA